MSTSTDNVLVATTGSALVAPIGTTAPTSTSGAWAAGWVDLGYLSDAGIVEVHDDQKKDVTAWQNGDTVRKLITGSAQLYKYTILETTKAAMELFYKGSVVTGTTGGPATLSIKSPTTDKRAFGFDVIDGTQLVRMVIPNGEVVERGDIVYKNDEAVGYEITVVAYPNASRIHTLKYQLTLSGL